MSNLHSIIRNTMQGVIKNSFESEGLKGRDTTISTNPVDLEPPFILYELKYILKHDSQMPLLRESDCIIDQEERRVNMHLYFSSGDDRNWKQFKSLLNEISNVKTTHGALCSGNSTRIIIQFSIEKSYQDSVRKAFKTHFPNIQIHSDSEHCFAYFFEQCKICSNDLYDLRDYYPDAYYWENIGEVSDTENSPLISIFYALSQLKENEFGFYQIVFKKVENNWNDNIKNLILAENETIYYSELYQNQNRFHFEHYKEAKAKINAHSYFAVSLRTGLFSKNANRKESLESIDLFAGKLRYGNKELKYLSKADYESILTNEQIIEMIQSDLVYRPGMILTTSELNILYHISHDILSRKDISIDKAVNFPVPELCQNDGVLLGETEYEGARIAIKQPESIRNRHTLISGKISMGKSKLIENMFLDDARKGKGAAIIDPVSDSAQEILSQFPQERKDDLVYFNPGLKQVFKFNSFEVSNGDDINLKTEQYLMSVRELYTEREWSYKTEQILYSIIYTLCSAPSFCLSDVRILLSKSHEGKMLLQKALPCIDNEEVKLFWTERFHNMPSSDIERAYGKLRRFLQPKKISRIFSQRQNAINFSDIMNQKKLFVADLNSGVIGSDAAKILGSLLISNFYHAGMQRLSIEPKKRVPFTLYVDELSNFKVKSLEMALLQLRKCKVNLVLAFQQYEGLSDSIRMALGNCGTLIVFNQDFTNAHSMFREFCGYLDVNEFMNKGVGEAYVKIMGNNVVNLSTFGQSQNSGRNCIDEILRYNYAHYYSEVPISKANNNSIITDSFLDEEMFDEI